MCISPHLTVLSLLTAICFMTTGCGKHDLQFTYDRSLWQWEAHTQFPASPFSTSTVKIQVVGDEMPLRPDQLALVQRIVVWLPELMPQITKQLGEYDEDLKDPKVMREQLTEPSICLFKPDEQPSRTWSLTVERPTHGPAFGYHLEFVERDFQEVWAGD